MGGRGWGSKGLKALGLRFLALPMWDSDCEEAIGTW